MRAIVLAGGKGTRLAPYTTVLPKPLMPIGDVPILEVVLRQLGHHGFRRVSLAVGYLSELLMAYCGDGQKFGVALDYSREEKPLGTAGPIALVKDLDATFLVMNGDLLTTVDYSAMLKAHRESGAIATVATFEKTVKIDLGVLELSAEQQITDYIEKPTMRYQVSMGIYLFEPRILSFIKNGERLDLPDLVKTLLGKGERVHAYRHGGYWLDIGRHDDYLEAQKEFEEHRSQFLPERRPGQ
ncbi:MAG: NTP transferase domain-containing protein [Archangium sp.]|nr:NTP transferase domain-containing protein [Archangium sp.]